MNGEKRADKMTEREVTPRLPTSGQILGALVAKLGIRHPVLQSRTACRYFAADPAHLVKDSTREEIIKAIGEVLTNYGLYASQQEGDSAFKPETALASVLEWHAEHWDLMRSFLRRRTIDLFPSNLPRVWRSYVRLTVIDIALRVAANLHIARSASKVPGCAVGPVLTLVNSTHNSNHRGDFRQAQEVDDEEDRRYGQSKRGDELPQELAFREGRLRKIREAMAALEAEAQAAAEQAEAAGKGHSGVPEDRTQRNFTDPESHIMPAPGGRDFMQAYNCQAVVDSGHQVIVAAQATDQTSDKQQAVAMVEETIDNVGAVPKEVSADAGYYSAQAVEGLYGLGVDPFVAPERTRHGRVVPPAPRGRIPSHLSPRDRMRRKLQTKRGRQRYALRMQTVEPVFGQIKQGRGFRQFLLRGSAASGRLHRPQPAQTVQASRNTERFAGSVEHRQGGQHSEAYETIGPSVAAPGNNSCRRLTPPVPKARQSILRRAARVWRSVRLTVIDIALRVAANLHIARSAPKSLTVLTLVNIPITVTIEGTSSTIAG